MALHKTQCPHCFTTYVISDEQYRVSQGIVRCGRCREQFEARLDSTGEVPKFDPREAFIEPVSQSPSTPSELDASVADPDQTQSIHFADDALEAAVIEPFANRSLSENVSSQLSVDVSAEPSEQAGAKSNSQHSESESNSVVIMDSRNLSAEQILANIRAKQERAAEREQETLTDLEGEQTPTPTTPAQGSLNLESTTPHPTSTSSSTITPTTTSGPSSAGQPTSSTQRERRQIKPPEVSSLSSERSVDGRTSHLVSEHVKKSVTPLVGKNTVGKAASDSKLNIPSAPQTPQASPAPQASDEQLIDEVDELIQSKILKPVSPAAAARPQTAIASESGAEPAFTLDTPKRRTTSGVSRWLFLPLTILLLALFAALLLYQMWIKQWLVLPPHSNAEQRLSQLSADVAQHLSAYNVSLPTRRNLAQLELVSARTEPHPERPSTMLLRVSLLNHAEIAQPMPWLELSLIDSDGKIVSRRSLTPADYLYNNTSASVISARELKRFTIELLSFPKSATGYELRLLNTE